MQCNKFLVNNAMSQVANEFVASDSDGVCYFMSFFSVIVIIHSHTATTLMLNIYNKKQCLKPATGKAVICAMKREKTKCKINNFDWKSNHCIKPSVIV